MEENKDKSAFFTAIELITANPEDIQIEVEILKKQFEEKYKNECNEEEMLDRIANKIISKYSYYAAYSGGVTALAAVVPGIGTAVAVTGGISSDIVMCMKFQIEMTMAIASLYGHVITNEEEKKICFLIAGIGTINKTAQAAAKKTGASATIKITKEYLKGASLQLVKEIFKKVGITFTRKALERSIPFGIGVVIGFSANKGLTYYIGKKAKEFYKAD